MKKQQNGAVMQTLEQQRVLITGGSRGLGLGVVEALVARHANVTVIARDSARLNDLKVRLGVSIIIGDATDPRIAESALREARPSVLVLNAGATPTMAPLHEQTWESFSKNWNTDVRSTFNWIQGALRLPLERGSRVLMSSSGAAIEGSPLSGGYAGAKRMIWMMAGYANGVASDLNLGIRFQALLVRQIIGATELGRAAAEAYARRKGVSAEAFLAGFGKPLSPRDFGEHVVTLLTDPKYESATAFGIRGETGVELLKA
ncbi:MAG TPA: SDR family oxidoreductase [Blastocatellia bacterium]|nr:SDR family oxidoreductase [Blastocatellia bacterium]